MDDIFKKFRSKFLDEAAGLLDKLESDLLLLESNPSNKELIESAFRAMHTLKGVSSMYGFDAISDFTHLLESIYQAVKDKKMLFNKEISNHAFLSIDHIRKLLNDEKLENTELKKKHLVLLEKTRELAEKEINVHQANNKLELQSLSQKNTRTYNILLSTNEQLYFRGISITGIVGELSAIGKLFIEKTPVVRSNNEEIWSIFLTTEASRDELEEILMFIDDECTITQVANRDLYEEENASSSHQSISIAVTQMAHAEPSDDTHDFDNQTSQSDKQEPCITSEPVKRISVDAAKLDQLMFLVSELITINSQLFQDLLEPQYEPLRDRFEKIDDLTRLFRENAIELRLVPLSDTILRFQRLIRDLSIQLHKKVELKTLGIEAELDKNTVDQLAEPLMHIIRNSIDHGIELPEVRKNKGKTEMGTIEIKAAQSGNNILITITDDGSGIDIQKVRNKAIEKGFITPSENPSTEELFDFIFLPGFSTAQNLTDVSGRGVGMDVVKKKISDLRGEIKIISQPEKGTSFILKLQQSLSILDSLLFKIENCYFTIPVSEVEACDDIDFNQFNHYKQTTTLNYNNKLVPFLDIRQTLNITGEYTSSTKKIIINTNDKRLAILADSIVGKHQAVLKPLGQAFKNISLFSSASQLGDGNIAFMLDTNNIIRSFSKIM